MKSQFIFIQNIVLLFMLFLNSGSVQAEQIRIVTEDFAPFQYAENRQVVGMATEVVRAVMRQTNVKGTIKIYPWARAYDMALDEKDILIYSIARTKEREPLFKWVGPIAPYNVYLFKLKARADIVVNTLEDAKKYRIGGAYQDVKQLYLVSQGVKTIDLVPNGNLNIQKLFVGRVDLIPFDELGFAYKVRHLGLDVSKVEKAYFLQGISSGLYMAFSRQTSDTIVEQFRQALLKVKADGRHEKIIAKYIRQKD